MSRRVVAWLVEDSWRATVEVAAGMAGTRADEELVLLHVVDGQVGEAVRGTFGRLLGRGSRSTHPDDEIARLARETSERLLHEAQRHAGRAAVVQSRFGRVEREVVAAAAGADLLVCARDGDHSRLGPRSIGRDTRFVVDHAPCAVLLIWPNDVPDLASIPPPPGRRRDRP